MVHFVTKRGKEDWSGYFRSPLFSSLPSEMEALASFSSSLVSFGASASIFESSDCSRPSRLFFPFGRRAMRGLLVTCAAETVDTTPSPSPSPSGSLTPDELKAKEVKLWGCQFEERVTDVVERSTEAISFDKELYKHDIMGSRAHASCFYTSMLAKQVLAVHIINLFCRRKKYQLALLVPDV